MDCRGSDRCFDQICYLPTCSRGSYVNLTVTRRGSVGQCLISCQITRGLIFISVLVLSMKKLEEPCSSTSCLVDAMWRNCERSNSPANAANAAATALCPLTRDFSLYKQQLIHALIRPIIVLSPVLPCVCTRGLSGHVSSR